MPLPIAAASRANCERALLGAASPFASSFCCCDRSDWRCCEVGAFCRFCAWARMVRNSVVRSCIDVTMFVRWLPVQHCCQECWSLTAGNGRYAMWCENRVLGVVCCNRCLVGKCVAVAQGVQWWLLSRWSSEGTVGVNVDVGQVGAILNGNLSLLRAHPRLEPGLS